jgi:hypothetical protein
VVVGGSRGPPLPPRWPPVLPDNGVPPRSAQLQKDRAVSENEKKSTGNISKETRRHIPMSDTASSAFDDDDDHESAMKIISKFMRVRKVFRVGRMGHGSNHENYFRVSPKKEGLLLLNEYGRKLVNEARKHEL